MEAIKVRLNNTKVSTTKTKGATPLDVLGGIRIVVKW